MNEQITIQGGCHCRAIRFSANISRENKTLLCNCSVCSMTGYEHLIVLKTEFSLESDPNDLTKYQFGTKQAGHLFCKKCGIKSFYQPRSHPDSYSVHVKCIDDISELDITQEFFDGRNWERAKEELTEID